MVSKYKGTGICTPPVEVFATKVKCRGLFSLRVGQMRSILFNSLQADLVTSKLDMNLIILALLSLPFLLAHTQVE